MYMIDANVFMNAVLVAALAVAGVLLALTLGLSAYGKTGPVMSYLYMFTALFGVFAVAVVILGFRGKKSDAAPWHLFLDMKYQPKYTSQGQSKFFADGRSNRLPPEGTVPFDGTDYAADAGRHADPNPDFLRADRRYYTGVADPDAKDRDPSGVALPRKPLWKDGKLAGEGYWVNHIPADAVKRAGGYPTDAKDGEWDVQKSWRQLLTRGEQQFGVHCAVCHGASGRGGSGEAAYGIVGAYGLSVGPSNMTTPEVQSQADGQLFGAISNGVRTMPAYAHQIRVQDRWAIVAYVRVLQYAAGR